MNFFLYSGEPDTGKTTGIFHMYQYMVFLGYKVVFANQDDRWNQNDTNELQELLFENTNSLIELSLVMSNGSKSVILHSTSDSPNDIDTLIALQKDFKEYNNANGMKYPEISTIISTIRSPYTLTRKEDNRMYFLDVIKPYDVENYCFELPLGKTNRRDNKRETVRLWFASQIHADAIHILSHRPYKIFDPIN